VKEMLVQPLNKCVAAAMKTVQGKRNTNEGFLEKLQQ